MDFLNGLWAFANSQVGLAIVVTALTLLVTWILTKKPEWKAVLDKYRPVFVSAVKEAEKAIPDSTPDAGTKRLDEALKYIIKVLEASGQSIPAANVLEAAITAVHAEMETNGNL
jgi:hypothetical protein